MLRSDPCSHRAFLHNQRDVYLMEGLLDELSGWQGLKLFLAEDRGMIPTGELKSDAERGGFTFECIKGSSHFVMFDRPEDVARSIENNIATSRERK